MQTINNDITNTRTEPQSNWTCRLDDYSVLTVSGADAQTFLQGQTTCDFKQLKTNHWTMGALCNPKGRVISVFYALSTETCFLLIIPSTMLEIVHNRLKMFVLRSDVEIKNETERLQLIGFSIESDNINQIKLPGGNAICSVNSQSILRCHSKQEQPDQYLMLCEADAVKATFQQFINLGLTICDKSVWHQQEIRNGIPTINQQTSEAFTPQMLNLDLLNAISFEKGCYTGQEVVARTQHLGTLKRRMFELSCSSRIEVEPGTPIFSASAQNQGSVGQVTCSVKSEHGLMMLAVLQKSAIHTPDLIINTPDAKAVTIVTSFDPALTLA